MLREISEANYGNDSQEHLKHLYEIKAGKYPAPIMWVPGEVLELVRFSQPEDLKWKLGSTGERGHWMRLFSCAVLIRAEVEHENSNYFIGVAQEMQYSNCSVFSWENRLGANSHIRRVK